MKSYRRRRRGRRSRPDRRTRPGARPARPQRRRQDDHRRDVRGVRHPRCGLGPSARTRSGRRLRRAAATDRRDAARRRRLPRVPCRARCSTSWPSTRPIRSIPDWLLHRLGLQEARPYPVPTAVRRPAAASRAGVRPGGPTRTGVPRRTHRRSRRTGPSAGVGTDRRAAPRRRERAADHAPDGRGRGTRRRTGHHRSRQRRGVGNPDEVMRTGRRGPVVGRRPRPAST